MLGLVSSGFGAGMKEEVLPLPKKDGMAIRVPLEIHRGLISNLSEVVWWQSG